MAVEMSVREKRSNAYQLFILVLTIFALLIMVALLLAGAFAFAILVMVVAGSSFIYKMTEFAVTIVRDDVEGFGAVAVATYLVGMVPLVFVTLWAVLTGKFRDIERPKFRLLELDREIERGGELVPEPRHG